jgi:hypothetical protein
MCTGEEAKMGGVTNGRRHVHSFIVYRDHSGAKENVRLFIYGERSRIEREIKAKTTILDGKVTERQRDK